MTEAVLIACLQAAGTAAQNSADLTHGVAKVFQQCLETAISQAEAALDDPDAGKDAHASAG